MLLLLASKKQAASSIKARVAPLQRRPDGGGDTELPVTAATTGRGRGEQTRRRRLLLLRVGEAKVRKWRSWAETGR
uniref:Uncharacterized protein n=1 Tax=Oryza barthii TaxID=65489 RepID=A0A0D3FF07_9ORYZ